MLAHQAEREAGPPTKEEEVGTWFSNPGAEGGNRGASAPASTTSGGGGVGKYLSAGQLSQLKPPGDSAEQQAAVVSPPAKKAKQAGYGNFDAW